MHLSQFDKDATLDKNGRVSVTGVVVAETDDMGKVVARTSPVQFHFLIVQGEHILQGEATALGDRWGGTTDDAGGLTPGPAVALGLGVEVKKQPTPTFVSSTWVEEITLRAP